MRIPKLENGTGAKRLTGPMIVACHWNILSPVGPAEQEDGGSRPRSINSCRETRLAPCRVMRRYHCSVSDMLGRGGNNSHGEIYRETTMHGKKQTLLMRLRAIGTTMC